MVNTSQQIKRIALVLSSIPGYSETFFRNKISGLQAQGYEVILCIDYWSEHVKTFPCKVVVAPNFTGNRLQQTVIGIGVLLKSLLFSPKQSYKHYLLDKEDGIPFKKRIKQIIQNQFFFTLKVDWLHFGFGMLAVNREQVAQVIDAKMAVSFRGFDLYLSPLKHPNCYNTLFKKVIKYHVLADEMIETLVNDYSIAKSSIVKIPPAINVSFFSNANTKQIKKPLQLITIARLHWKKGLEYTLEALALLNEAGVSFKYTIIGDGTQRERLVFAAHQLGVSHLVDFKGKMSQQDVKTHLEDSDIYLQYSIQEGFCNAVLEAQAMGLLCIVSNAEGLSENVLHNQTGWVVSKRQPMALAKQIIEVLKLTDIQHEAIRNAAIKRVNEQFNIEQQMQAFIDFYQK